MKIASHKRVLEPKWFSPDPNPIFQIIPGPVPDPGVCKIRTRIRYNYSGSIRIKDLTRDTAYSHLREVDNLDEAEEAGPRLRLQVFRAAPDTAVLPTEVHTLSRPVLGIRVILVRIRIRGSIPLNNGPKSGFGYGSGSGSYYFRKWPSSWQLKIFFITKIFCLLLFEATFTSLTSGSGSSRLLKTTT